jgi:DNA-binding LacI/PurR family transcriptional regulator
LVIRVPAHRDGGVQAVRRIMAMADRPTALFLTDPLTSLGAVGEARRLGLRVPTDLSIVGFDDAELRLGVVPQLTAVCQDSRALGREAVTLLVNVTSKPKRAPGKPLRCWFEVHETTGRRPIIATSAGFTTRRSKPGKPGGR